MQRTLSLVLNEDCTKNLTLMIGDSKEIDNFTKNFEDSEQIREHFKEQIDEYLKQNENYLNNQTRLNRGRIVVLEAHKVDDHLEYVQKKVLYKKHFVAFDEIIKDKSTMQRFVCIQRQYVNETAVQRTLVSQFVIDRIKCSNFNVPSQVNLIKRELKKDRNYNDILRAMVKAYELEREHRELLPTIDCIYAVKKNSKKQNKKENVESLMSVQAEENDLQQLTFINGEPHDIQDIELDKINPSDDLSGLIPDGLGPRI